MARPERCNVDYFPFYCEDGKKMFYIEETYGNDGFATFIKILRELGKTDNHYLDLSKNTTLMFLSAKCKISKDLLISIINDLVELGKFDEILWVENRIIWCQDFINSIQDAYKKRNNKCITYEGLLSLLSGLGVRKLSKLPSTAPGKPQRKEEEIKEEEIKEENKDEVPLIEPLNQRQKDLIDAIILMFGFNEMRFANKQRIVFQFVKNLVAKKQIDHFIDQYSNYRKYKEESGEILHSFHSLIGTPSNQFEDAQWDNENWGFKLNNFLNNKTNGTTKTPKRSAFAPQRT